MIVKIERSPNEQENNNLILHKDYNFSNDNGDFIVANFRGFSRIDKYPIFYLDMSPPTPNFILSESKIEGYETDMSKIELITAIEDHIPNDSNNLEMRKLEIIRIVLESRGLQISDIYDDELFFQLVRELKINSLL